MEFVYDKFTKDWTRRTLDTKEYSIVLHGHRIIVSDFTKTAPKDSKIEYFEELMPYYNTASGLVWFCFIGGAWGFTSLKSYEIYNQTILWLVETIVGRQQTTIQTLETRMKKMEDVFDYIRGAEKTMDEFINVVRLKS